MLNSRMAGAFGLALTLIVSGCGGPSGPRGPRPSELPDELRGAAVGFNQTQTYTIARQMVEEGNCTGAQPALTCLAIGAEGFDGARHLLGSCLVSTDPVEKTPEQLAAIRAEGLTWIERAADAGWAEAQEELVRLYTEGQVIDRNLALAQKWLTLHDTNPMRIALGTDEIDEDVASTLAASISEGERAQGVALAGGWQRTTWQPASSQALPDECRPQTGPEGARAGGQRPNGARGEGRRGPRNADGVAGLD